MIPSVDIGPLGVAAPSVHELDSCLAQLDAAARATGMFVVEGHGVPEAQIAELIALVLAFFQQPEADKVDALVSSEQEGGYQVRDGANQVFFAPLLPMLGSVRWPSKPQRFKQATLDFARAWHGVGLHILRGFALLLHQPPSFFRELAGDDPQLLQLRYYAPREFPLLMAPHRDVAPITMLIQDTGGGLEAVVDGVAVEAPPRSGAIVCQVGDALERWSNRRYSSVVHQVTNRGANGRVSLVYGIGVRSDSVIECVPSCCAPENPSRYARTTYGTLCEGARRAPSSKDA